MRISPYITELKSNEVFVFGSNEAGIHGAGAALTARRKFGAKLGKGIGHVGKTYAIPTKNKKLKTLSLSRIGKYVDEFIEFAKSTPELKYFVTEIGCGLAGYKASDIAPLFKNAIYVENIYLPHSFWKTIQTNTNKL